MTKKEIKIKGKKYEVITKKENGKELIIAIKGKNHWGDPELKTLYKISGKNNCHKDILPCTKSKFRYTILKNKFKIL